MKVDEVVGVLLLSAVVGALVWFCAWDRRDDADRATRLLRCFGSEKVWQCQVSPRPDQCMRYLEQRAEQECGETRERGE